MDVEERLVYDHQNGKLDQAAIEAIDYISAFCGVDIFLLGPKLSPLLATMNNDDEVRVDRRWRVAIYGDMESAEHAKVRVLIQIDKWVWIVVLCLNYTGPCTCTPPMQTS